MIDLGPFVPELATAIVVGLVAGLAWARLARVGPLLGIATAVSLGAILALTFTPTGPFPPTGFIPGVCDLSHLGPGTLDELLTIGEPGLNVALFIPLGICVILQRPGTVRRVAIAMACVLPFAIEVAQLKLPALGRYCDSMDIADNELGLVIGLGVGAMLLGLGRFVRSLRRAHAPVPLGDPRDPT